MAVAALSSALRSLDDALRESSLSGSLSVDPVAICHDIRQIVMAGGGTSSSPALSTAVRAACSDLLFAAESPPSLLAFIDKASYPDHETDKSLQKARVEGTQIIRDYMENFPESADGYQGLTLRCFYAVFKRDKSNPVRAETFGVFEALLGFEEDGGLGHAPIASVMKMTVSNDAASSYGTERPLALCFKKAAVSTKLNATIRGRALRFLGKLSWAYPAEMRGRDADTVFEFCVQHLTSTTGSAIRDSDVETAGSLDGLRYLFMEFPGLLADARTCSVARRDELYREIFSTSIVSVEKRKRFAIPEAALRLIASHASLFRSYIVGKDALSLFRRLARNFLCINKRVKQAAPAATKAVLELIAAGLMQQSSDKNGASDGRARFDVLRGYFHDLLYEGCRATFLHTQQQGESYAPHLPEWEPGSSAEKSADRLSRELAVTGLGLIAGPVRNYEGAVALRELVVQILDSELIAAQMALELKNKRQAEGLSGDDVNELVVLDAVSLEERLAFGTANAIDLSQDIDLEDANSVSSAAAPLSYSASSSSPATSSSSSTSGPWDKSRYSNNTHWSETKILEACSHALIQYNSRIITGSSGSQAETRTKRLSIDASIISRLAVIGRDLMLTYHGLSKYLRAEVCRALNLLFVSMAGRGKTLVALLNEINMDVVLLQAASQLGNSNSASNDPDQAMAIPRFHPITGLPETRLCFDYIEMWVALSRQDMVTVDVNKGRLSVSEFMYADDHGGEDVLKMSDPIQVSALCLFDTMMSSVLSIISRLQLGEIRVVQQSDGSSTTMPRNIVDMDLFLNLTTFLQELIPRCESHLFSRWLPIFFERVTAHAVQPDCHNVSGFYRLLTLALKAGNHSMYFTPMADRVKSKARNVGTRRDPLGPARCADVIRPFLLGVHQRVHSYTDELLASCLEFVLSIPNPTLVSVDYQVPFLTR